MEKVLNQKIKFSKLPNDIKEQIIWEPCKSKEELDDWLRSVLGVYLANTSLQEGNSSPMDFLWDCYSSALTNMEVKYSDDNKEVLQLTDDLNYDIVGIASRGSQKTLCVGVLELLLLLHDPNRDLFHMASIRQQSKVAYRYIRNFLNKSYLKNTIKKSIESETEGLYSNILQIGTGTMDSVNSFHGCYDIDNTRVLVPSGYIKMRDLLAMKRKPEYIDSDKGFRKLVATKNFGHKDCVEITTHSGRKINVTKNHQIMIFNEGGVQLKSADTINESDYLIIKHSSKWPGCNLPRNKYCEVLQNKDIKSLCYVLGRMIGDGCVMVKNRMTITTVSEIDANKLVDLWKLAIPGCNPYITYKRRVRCYDVNICSKNLKKDILSLGVEKKKAPKKTIPEFIFRMGKKLFYEWLSGYWDADGTSKLGDGEYGQSAEVMFCSTSYELLRQVQDCLARDGINGRIRLMREARGNWSDCFSLECYSGHAINLARKIKSRTSTDKYDKLQQIARLSNRECSDKWDSAYISKIFKNIKTNFHSKVKSNLIDPKYDSYKLCGRTNYFNKRTIKRFLQETIECCDHQDWQKLSYIISTSIWSDRVVSIKEVGKREVGDVQIANVPLWCPNLVVSHNSIIQDEVDLTDRAVFKESSGMLSPTKDGRMALNVAISSRKFAFGNIQTLLDNKDKMKLKIHQWGVLENTKHCTDERSGTEEIDIWVDEEDLMHLSEEQYKELDDENYKEKFTKIKGFEGCESCPIFSFCQTKLKKQAKDNPYLVPIEMTIKYFQREDPEFFKAQRLNRKPSRKGLVYPQYSEGMHVCNWNQMWETLYGEPPVDKQSGKARNITKKEFIQECRDLGLERYIAVDFGFNNGHMLLIFVDGKEHIYLVDEIVTEQKSSAEMADIADVAWGPYGIDEVYPDPEDPGGAKEFEKRGFTINREIKKTQEETRAGFGTVRRLLRIPGTLKTLISINYECVVLREQMALYHYKIDPKTDEPTDLIYKKEDHGCDGLRYCIHTRFGKEPVKIIIDRGLPTRQDLKNLQGAPTPDELAAFAGISVFDNRKLIKKKIKKVNDNDDDDGSQGGPGFNFTFA